MQLELLFYGVRATSQNNAIPASPKDESTDCLQGYEWVHAPSNSK
ncbi:1259_t:CDS:2 [Funneliformis mosseae]|uniref:1259_t:CDS:1 n=1 Tax=Funneliformis mosseae TaxID=27381 RepID=A0A9N9A7F0_FUNMO|nr:1259_t:CDS:2 [Funneliformis mosseae]